ncbi:beta-ketoacyl synthase N-terminal-like domain-containing protein [Formosa maritima]|uniref:Beta-ketoacyl synthase n=1 Tax=Formosa maritima TaxID=2592046 RepID=A0A5D0G2P1_9FLAO|nr:beta-ketoacyl synthase N-terminal-like domain-containing protein [Formosa maritima]TYA52137.1 beta-ketoacyl synthase [Formosa maritima]
MIHPISITSLSSLSPLGKSSEEIWQAYKNNQHYFSTKYDNLVAEIPQEAKKEIKKLRASDSKYKALDDTVLLAIYTSRQAVKQAGWNPSDNFGINIGSSRGATALFENHHEFFINKDKVKPLSSPTTTLGNISSWVAHDLQTQGPEISHSITCSTALHGLLNGVAWINSGMCDKFLVGGSEAPLTAFTIAQMQALKIYSHSERSEEPFPCLALDLNKKQNTMILAEAASMTCLEQGEKPNALAKIIGVGYATEILEHNASLSTDAICFQRSMKMALGDLNPDEIDVIVTHTPGTIKGDISEVNAIKSVFGEIYPALTTNKWKLGHSLGTSGMLNIEMAILMLQHQEFIPLPFMEQTTPKKLKNILVNAVGFGGNAVSILLSK